MSRYLFLFSFVVLISVSSCEKTGTVKACFTFSKESAKVNDTLYLLNCSENYQKFIWFNSNGFYPGGAVVDSLSRHQRVVVTSTGQYSVRLWIGNNDMYTSSTSGYTELIKSVTVNP